MIVFFEFGLIVLGLFCVVVIVGGIVVIGGFV